MVVDMQDVSAIRQALAAAGYRPVPVMTNQKRPHGFAWTTTARGGSLPPLNGSALNTGILCDGLRVIDIDIDDPAVSGAIFNLATARFGAAPERFRTNSARRTLVYRAATGEPPKGAVSGSFGKVEVLGYGQQFVAYGGHPSGVELAWRDRAPHEWPVASLPTIEEPQIEAFLDDCSTIIGAQPKAHHFAANPASSDLGETSIDEIDELLGYIPADCGYHDWLEILMAIHDATGGSGDGFMMADTWSSRASNYKGTADVAAKWRSFKSGGMTGRTIALRARDHGADLAAIAIKHNVPAYVDDGYDPNVLLDGLMAKRAAREGIRQITEAEDGTLTDSATGEVVEPQPTAQMAGQTLDYPKGLVGRIARWVVATSRRRQPELAIGAALALVGTLAGRQYQGPTESATHLYVLGLAPTGTGKDHALQQMARLLNAAKLSHHIGPSEFISMPAVVNFLMRKPLSLCAMDEFGSFMKRINGRNASGFESAISKVLRTMWSTSFAPYQTPEWAQKQSEIINTPAMTIYGASTPEQFYSAMEGASLEDGTLNRFLLINGQPDAPEHEPDGDKAMVPTSIVADMSVIYYRSGMTASTWRNDPSTDPAGAGLVRKLGWCPDGSRERYMAFSEQMNRRARDPEHGAFFARTAEMAVRIATIIAVGRLDDDQVRIDDLEYGIAVALASATMMQAGAADYMAENENQANAQRILRLIRKRGGRCNRRDLVQALNGMMKPRDLNDVLGMLCEGGGLEKQEVKNPKGSITTWYQVTDE